LLAGEERLDERGRDRMLLGLRIGDPHDDVLGAWLAKESVREVYLTDDLGTAATLLDKAIDIANSLPFAFQASVFSAEIAPAMRAARRLDASTVLVNDHTAFRTDWMPFAGRRQSGYGVGGIPYSMEEMAQEKMLVLRYDG